MSDKNRAQSNITGIRAQVHVLSAAEGGRRSGFFNGYRPSFVWPETLPEVGGNDGEITIDGKDICQPGEDVTISVTFYHPELIPKSINVGTPFRICEGPRVIGRGNVIQVMR